MVRNAKRKLKQSVIAKLNKKTKRDEEQVLYYGLECNHCPKEKSSDSNQEKEGKYLHWLILTRKTTYDSESKRHSLWVNYTFYHGSSNTSELEHQASKKKYPRSWFLRTIRARTPSKRFVHLFFFFFGFQQYSVFVVVLSIQGHLKGVLYEHLELGTPSKQKRKCEKRPSSSTKQAKNALPGVRATVVKRVRRSPLS